MMLKTSALLRSRNAWSEARALFHEVSKYGKRTKAATKQETIIIRRAGQADTRITYKRKG